MSNESNALDDTFGEVLSALEEDRRDRGDPNWDNWRYPPRISVDPDGNIVGFDLDAKNSDHSIRLLLVDDELAEKTLPGKFAPSCYCQENISLKGGQWCPTGTEPVVVYWCDFKVEKQLLEQGIHRFGIDGIFQDLMDGKKDIGAGGRILKSLRNEHYNPKPAVLIVSQTNDDTLVNDAIGRPEMRLGNHFEIRKGRSEDAFRDSQIEKFFARARTCRDVRISPFSGELQRFVGVDTLSAVMRFLNGLDHPSDDNRDGLLPVVILGETGTGKEHIARLIHEHDRQYREVKRGSDRFVPVNCIALADSLMENELFGYVDGAFTDARRGEHRGYLAEAANGTIFFDELGELSPVIQAKLLRVIQELEVYPVGSTSPVSLKGARFVFASHDMAIANQIISRSGNEASGRYRADFIYRIDGFTFRVPALADRSNDVQSVLDYFFLDALFSVRDLVNWNIESIASDVMLELRVMCQDGCFQGNLRQLKMLIRRIVMIARERLLDHDGACQIAMCDLLSAREMSLLSSSTVSDDGYVASDNKARSQVDTQQAGPRLKRVSDECFQRAIIAIGGRAEDRWNELFPALWESPDTLRKLMEQIRDCLPTKSTYFYRMLFEFLISGYPESTILRIGPEKVLKLTSNRHADSERDDYFQKTVHSKIGSIKKPKE